MVVINIVWFAGSFYPYLRLKMSMKKNPGYSDNTVRDAENYCYAVKLPAYMIWNDGNISVAAPLYSEKDTGSRDKMRVSTADGLIVWLKHWTGTVELVGVTLQCDDQMRQIELLDSGTAVHKDDQIYVDEKQDEIERLFRKAEIVWNIEMPWKK